MEAPDSFMARSALAQENEKDVAETVVKYRRWKTNQVVRNLVVATTILAVVFLVSAIIKAVYVQRNLGWLVEMPGRLEEIGSFATLLAPFIAISVAIERFLEQIFDYLEKSLVSVADFLKAPVDFLKVLQDEYKEAYNAVKEASKAAEETPTRKTKLTLAEAKKKLADIEEMVRNTVKTPEYIAWKRFLTTFIAFLLGLLLAVLGDLGMLRTIGVPTPRLFDMFVTGLVIGAGPGPMHSIIGILQNGKDALGQLASLSRVGELESKLADIQKEMDELRQV